MIVWVEVNKDVMIIMIVKIVQVLDLIFELRDGS